VGSECCTLDFNNDKRLGVTMLEGKPQEAEATKVDLVDSDAEKSGQKQLSAEELAQELQQLRSTNERLLNENKQHKAKRQMAEQDKLLAEGKKDELIKRLNDEVNSFKAKEESLLIADAVAREADRRGCKRWDQLYKLTDGEGIELDSDNGTVVGVKEFFDKYQNDPEYDIFFKNTPVVKTENRVPSKDASLIDIDYRKNPTEYLYQVKKKHPEKYAKECERLWQEGILR
jgi:hypothetical protein